MAHAHLVYLHILLFVFWLGVDVGVYYAGKFLSAPGIEIGERKRMLYLLLLLDMGPRTSLVLMVPVGLQLGTNLGLLPLDTWMPFVWVLGIGWLATVWLQFLKPQHSLKGLWFRIDYTLRFGVVLLFIGFGLYAIFFDAVTNAAWLRLKLVLFGAVVSIGLILRSTLPALVQALEALSRPEPPADAQLRLAAVYRYSTRWAHALWALVLVLGYLGTVKPF